MNSFTVIFNNVACDYFHNQKYSSFYREDNNHKADFFPRRNSKLSMISVLNRVCTNLADVHANITWSILKSFRPLLHWNCFIVFAQTVLHVCLFYTDLSHNSSRFLCLSSHTFIYVWISLLNSVCQFVIR